MTAHDIESESLPAHVSLCQERYASLERRFESVDEKITDLGVMIRDIHDRVDAMSQATQDRFQSWHWAVTGSLATAVVFLLERWLA